VRAAGKSRKLVIVEQCVLRASSRFIITQTDLAELDRMHAAYCAAGRDWENKRKEIEERFDAGAFVERGPLAIYRGGSISIIAARKWPSRRARSS
jgi:hypothetical protein